MAEKAQVQETIQAHTPELFTLPNVVGVGVGFKVSHGEITDELSVIVMVTQKLPPAALKKDEFVPKQINGIRTDVMEVGEFKAFQARTDRWRPAPPGVSLGHYQITAGTFGCVVRDRASGARLILSNNHVIANSNNATLGDPILQPGPADGGQLRTDAIARLERFCPIEFNTTPGTCQIASAYARIGNLLSGWLGSQHRLEVIVANPQAVNLVDAAVASPTEDSLIVDEILEIGPVTGTLPAYLGMPVRKSGRTTSFTTGTITVMDATVSVSYGTGRVATFENQLIAGPMSQGGDSGSLVVAAAENKAVGLLFAGSAQSTIFNPMQAVLDCLEIEI